MEFDDAVNHVCRCGRPARIFSGATDANYCSVECSENARLLTEIQRVEAELARRIGGQDG